MIMFTQGHGAPEPGDSSEKTAEQGFDPRDTEHPTGSEQAAKNADEESPS